MIDRIVRPKETSIITGRSLASIWRDEQEGKFVPKIRIGQNSVGYRLSAIMEWLESREVVTAENVIPICLGAARGRRRSVNRISTCNGDNAI